MKIFHISLCFDGEVRVLPSMEPGRIPNYVIKVKGVLAICPISYKAAATSSPSLPASINRILSFIKIKADARALPSEGEIVMGIQSPGLGVLRVLNLRSHLVSVDRTSLVPSGLFG